MFLELVIETLIPQVVTGIKKKRVYSSKHKIW